MTDLQKQRASKDRFFATDAHSPLTHEQKQHFAGLHYFPENPSLRLTLSVEKDPDHQSIQMKTTTGDVQTFIRYGRIRFDAGSQEVALTIFANHNGFFLPFADSLAGKETYGAGRYLDLQPIGGDRFLVDFNNAYNPYCAYNDAWSCPITPAENRLKIAIRAGEKVFHS